MKTRFKAIIILSIFFTKLSAQSDTLHIYYTGVDTMLRDSNETMMRKWTKGLKGKKTNIQVIAYYSDEAFKNDAQKRAGDLSRMLKRKAPRVINITFIGLAKSPALQRPKVDLIYTPAPIKLRQSGGRGG